MAVYIGFFALSVLMLFSPFWVFREASINRKIVRNYVLGVIIWVAYLVLLINSGILNSFDLPPRLPVFIIIPCIIFGIILSGRPWFKEIINSMSPHRVVIIQSFRIMVELLIFGAFLNGIFPKRATFEGLNFDILVGISAVIIGFMVWRRIVGNKGVLIWNIVSLSILSLTGFSFIYSYYFAGFDASPQALKFVNFPYVLLPAILLQFAIFYHVVSIRKSLLKGADQ